MKRETIAVVGLGYVGLPLALLADQKGYPVIGIDIDEHKVDLLKKRIPPFVDKDLVYQLRATKALFTNDFSQIKQASIVIICVPTPVHEDRMPNLGPVEAACRNIGPYVQEGQLIVLESTVNPGVSETVVLPILEAVSGFKAGLDFYVAHCPERINPGDTTWNVRNIPRVVGSLEKVGLEKALHFYRSVIEAEIAPMGSLKEAEAVKVVENSFRDINIAFVNELAMSFSHLGIDIMRVIQGATTKPFAFMAHYPGCGVGGHCIPVDPYYLIQYARENGFEHDFLSLARRINSKMPEFTADLVVKTLNERKIAINGTKVAVLGVAYKADIDDHRESPSFEIIKHLKDLAADVAVYDPYVKKQSYADSLDAAVDGAQAVVIATDHTLFKNLEPEYFLEKNVRVIVDGRNCLAKEKFLEAGIAYRGIGR